MEQESRNHCIPQAPSKQSFSDRSGCSYNITVECIYLELNCESILPWLEGVRDLEKDSVGGNSDLRNRA